MVSLYEDLLLYSNIYYYSHCSFLQNQFQYVALRPASRVAQCALIGQHAHSVVIGRTL